MRYLPCITYLENYSVKGRLRGKSKEAIEDFIAGFNNGFKEQKYQRYVNNIHDYKVVGKKLIPIQRERFLDDKRFTNSN